MEIKELKTRDISKAINLKINCWTEELNGQLKNTLTFDQELKFWLDWKNSEEENNDVRFMLGAYEKEELLGVAFVSFVQSKREPEYGIELNGLWVYPEYRRKGVSISLLLEIVDRFINLGVEDMIVYNVHYSKSNSYYRMLGGAVIKKEKQMDEELNVDVFKFNIIKLKDKLLKIMIKYNN